MATSSPGRATIPEEETLDTWAANERGELTLPMLLEEGDYTIVEVQAPYGYVKALEKAKLSTSMPNTRVGTTRL